MKLIDLTGQRFGWLLVIRREGSNKHKRAKWTCKCRCGAESVVDSASLRRGDTTSCGCKKTVYFGKGYHGRAWLDRISYEPPEDVALDGTPEMSVD
jgi:hypothetical protein